MGRRLAALPRHARLAAAIQRRAYNDNVILSLSGGLDSTFNAYTRGLSDTDREQVFSALPSHIQRACWDEIASDARLRRLADEIGAER